MERLIYIHENTDGFTFHVSQPIPVLYSSKDDLIIDFELFCEEYIKTGVDNLFQCGKTTIDANHHIWYDDREKPHISELSVYTLDEFFANL